VPGQKDASTKKFGPHEKHRMDRFFERLDGIGEDIEDRPLHLARNRHILNGVREDTPLFFHLIENSLY